MKQDKEPGRWLSAFPRAWRVRYGGELAALVDDLREEGDLRPSDRIDMVRSGPGMRRQRVTRRSAYGTVGVLLGAVCALIGLALSGTLSPSPTTPRTRAADRIVVAPSNPVVTPTQVGHVLLTCPATSPTVQVLPSRTVTLFIAQPSGGSAICELALSAGQ